MRFIVLLVLAFALSLPAAASEEFKEKPDADDLIAAYKALHVSMKEGDVETYSKLMSSFSFQTMRNHLASAKRTLDSKTIMRFVEYSPSLETVARKEVTVNGPTAQLAVACPEKTEDGSETFQLVYIRFVAEDKTWKVDKMGSIPNAEKSKIDNLKKALEASPLNAADFAADGKVKPAPEPVEKADHVGYLDVMSYGYRVTVTLNGHTYEDIAETGYSTLVVGGLSNGDNKISVAVKPNPETKADGLKSIKVTVRQKADDGAKEVFAYDGKASEFKSVETSIKVE